MKLSLVTVVLLAVLALGFSLLLIPQDGEVFLMKVRGGDYLAARQFLDVDPTARTVTTSAVDANSRAGVYLAFANVDGAIGVLEAAISARPGDRAARRRLLQVYDDGQRTGRRYFALLQDAHGGSVDAARAALAMARVHGSEAQRHEIFGIVGAGRPGDTWGGDGRGDAVGGGR